MPHCCLHPPGHHCQLWLLAGGLLQPRASPVQEHHRGIEGCPAPARTERPQYRLGGAAGGPALSGIALPPHAPPQATCSAELQVTPGICCGTGSSSMPEQPEVSGLSGGFLLPLPLKCRPCGISAVGFKWETNLSHGLGKDNRSLRGLHLLPKKGLPAAKAFDSPAPPCFLQRESANLALTFTEISEFSIQGRKGRW